MTLSRKTIEMAISYTNDAKKSHRSDYEKLKFFGLVNDDIQYKFGVFQMDLSIAITELESELRALDEAEKAREK